MKRLVVLVALLTPACALSAGGGDSVSAEGRSAGDIMEADGATFLKGAGYIFSAPIRWSGSSWLMFGATGLGTAAASGLDIDGRLFMQRHQSSAHSDLASSAAQYGSGVNMIALSAAGYIAGLVFDEQWLRETSFLAGSAILMAGAVSTVTKIIVGRARPYMGQGHMTFRPFSFPVEDYASFPSGHTIVAFAFSGVLAERIRNTWASIGLYALAASCGISRMYTDEHWVSDVLFGAVVSLSVSHSLVRWFESAGDSPGTGGLRIVPGPGSITLAWIF
jgi:membrane-associated phospholipid phosphatase